MAVSFTTYQENIDEDSQREDLFTHIIEAGNMATSPMPKGDVEEEQISGLPAKFRILKKLGQGGMGVVYLVEDDELGCQLAVKVIRVQNDVALNRFEVEAAAASALSHPHIAQVYSFVSASPEPYIVMEYVDGQSFDKVIKRERVIEQERLLNIVLQVCDAIEYAHLHQVIHRDLKPSNIVIRNENDLVKVIDFGIAKVGEQKESATQLTQKSEVFGSPMYMSPEQAQAGIVDERTDLYSLGCIIYEALSGRPLFAGDNAIQILLHHINTSPKNATRKLLKKGYSRSLVATIEKLLEKNPAHRYQSASELAADIHRILNRKPSFAFLRKPLFLEIPRRALICALAVVSILGVLGTCLYSSFTVATIERNAKNYMYENLVLRQNEAKELVEKISAGKKKELSLPLRALNGLLSAASEGYYGRGMMEQDLLETSDQEKILKVYRATTDPEIKLQLAKILALTNKPIPEVLSLACTLCTSDDKMLQSVGAEGASKWAGEASNIQQLEISNALSTVLMRLPEQETDENRTVTHPFNLSKSKIHHAVGEMTNFTENAIQNFRKSASKAPQDLDLFTQFGYSTYPHALVHVSTKQNLYFPELLCLLRSRSHAEYAARALCKLGTKAKDAVPELCRMLESSDDHLRKRACSVIAAIGPTIAPIAVPALARAMERHRPYESKWLAVALAKMGGPGLAVLKRIAQIKPKPAHLDIGGENAMISAAQDALLDLKPVNQ